MAKSTISESARRLANHVHGIGWLKFHEVRGYLRTFEGIYDAASAEDALNVAIDGGRIAFDNYGNLAPVKGKPAYVDGPRVLMARVMEHMVACSALPDGAETPVNPDPEVERLSCMTPLEMAEDLVARGFFRTVKEATALVNESADAAKAVEAAKASRAATDV